MKSSAARTGKGLRRFDVDRPRSALCHSDALGDLVAEAARLTALRTGYARSVDREPAYGNSPSSARAVKGVVRRFLVAGTAVFALVGGGVSASAAPAKVRFGPPVVFAAGKGPAAVAVDDFNGDANPDLAVANFYSNDVSILVGDGRGGFGGATSFAAGELPASVATGDFNGDGSRDLAVADSGGDQVPSPGNVAVLLGNGDGSFGKPLLIWDQGADADSVAVGDLNGDSRLDLAVANASPTSVPPAPETVSILLGTGSGQFAPPLTFPAGSFPVSVALGDFNADARPDLAVANYGSDSVSILLGKGDGSFSGPTSVPVGSNPQAVVVAELNGDAHLDLAVVDADGASILLGKGSGLFSGPTSFPAGGNQAALAVGDVDRDGTLDLAVANSGLKTVSILTGNGDGTFAAPMSFSAGGDAEAVASADLNHDSPPDLALAVPPDGVSVLLNAQSPTAVALRMFSAARVGTSVLLRWRTASETNILGFHLYRGAKRLNPRLIRAKHPGEARGASYRFRAPAGRGPYRLRLVNLDGTSQWQR